MSRTSPSPERKQQFCDTQIFKILTSPTIRDIIERIKTDKTKLGIKLYAPASLTDISNFESIKRLKLPDDVANFYSFSNGFDSAEDMFRIIPLNEIIDNIKDRDTYTVEPQDFHIAEY